MNPGTNAMVSPVAAVITPAKTGRLQIAVTFNANQQTPEKGPDMVTWFGPIPTNEGERFPYVIDAMRLMGLPGDDLTQLQEIVRNPRLVKLACVARRDGTGVQYYINDPGKLPEFTAAALEDIQAATQRYRAMARAIDADKNAPDPFRGGSHSEPPGL